MRKENEGRRTSEEDSDEEIHLRRINESPKRREKGEKISYSSDDFPWWEIEGLDDKFILKLQEFLRKKEDVMFCDEGLIIDILKSFHIPLLICHSVLVKVKKFKSETKDVFHRGNAFVFSPEKDYVKNFPKYHEEEVFF